MRSPRLRGVRFLADLHIHSYLSRATSKALTLEQLHRWAQLKGITVLGTGDFTHPRWLAELREKLVPAEDGLFALREDLARAVDQTVPAACRAPVRFLLSVEVSSIYKREGKVRKVHNLAYAPDLEAAARIATRLSGIGNIASDGRPILGLDSRDFLEIVLESSPDAFVIPAHVWTPWFSALGARSGFDAITECFADLAPHIFAAETGLSSDPAMNWRLSALDRYALVSNSDAHSPEKLGREANLFDCDLSYFALRDALRDQRERFLGTVEFFPEEGKYHFDGHRNCGVVLTPTEAKEVGGLCPKCGKRLTDGVLGRVESLADRPEGARPEGAKPFQSFIPLKELLGELLGTGAGSRRVGEAYDRLLGRVGPELALLGELPVDAAERSAPPLFGEALQRMRAGQVHLKPGYDGEYGVVRVFDEEERRALLAQRSFTGAWFEPSSAPERLEDVPPVEPPPSAPPEPTPQPAPSGLNPQQAQAVEHPGGPLLVLAGPGTGKTRVITQRIARLVRSGVSTRAVCAITFTRRAASELRERLVSLLGPEADALEASTFHSLGRTLLRDFAAQARLAPDFAILDEAERTEAIATAAREVGVTPTVRLASAIGWAKANLQGPDQCATELATVYAAYQRALEARGAVDFDDLVVRAVALLEASPEARASAQERCRYLFVDEHQDVNPAQERLVELLAPPGPETELCVVGDPDQAIYGFRGSDPACVDRFLERYPGATVVTLRQNYRSPAAVVRASTQVIERAPGRAARPLEPLAPTSPPIERVRLAGEAEEAHFIAEEIERVLGGTSLYSIDAGRADGENHAELSFHDVAVLFRTSMQADALAAALDKRGIPYQRALDDAPTARPEAVALIERLRKLADPSTTSEEVRHAAGVGRRPVADLIAGLVSEETSAEQRAAAELLATYAVSFGSDVTEFLAAVPLWQAGEVTLSLQKVTLATLHASKGLEFPLVFIAGCEHGLLPLELPGRRSDLEEERRLLYVGMTRAQRRLVLTEVERRVVQGNLLDRSPCPFLEGLPPELITEQRTFRARPRSPKQLALL